MCSRGIQDLEGLLFFILSRLVFAMNFGVKHICIEEVHKLPWFLNSTCHWIFQILRAGSLNRLRFGFFTNFTFWLMKDLSWYSSRGTQSVESVWTLRDFTCLPHDQLRLYNSFACDGGVLLASSAGVLWLWVLIVVEPRTVFTRTHYGLSVLLIQLASVIKGRMHPWSLLRWSYNLEFRWGRR
jgi:hypothetical protein